MANDINVNIKTAVASSSGAVFKKLSKEFKTLAANLRESAAAMKQMGNKEAATAIGHIAAEINKSALAFDKGTKAVKANTAALDTNAKKTEKLASNTKLATGALEYYKKTMGQIDGTYNAATKSANNVSVATANLATSMANAGLSSKKMTKSLKWENIELGLKNKSLQFNGTQLKINTEAGARLLGINEKEYEVLKKSSRAQDHYNNALAKTANTQDKYVKALRRMGGALGKENDRSKVWIAGLDAAVSGINRSVIAFKGQSAVINKTKVTLSNYFEKMNYVSTANQILRGNLRKTTTGFEIINREGLKPFKGLTIEAARSLGMLSSAFIRTLDAQKKSNAAWERTVRMMPQYSKVAAKLKRQVDLKRISIEQATKALKRYDEQQKRALPAIGKLGKGLSFVAAKFKSFAAYSLAAASVAAMLRGSMGAVSAIVQHSQALRDLEAITGATTDEMIRMDETIRQVAGTTKFSAGEVAQGMKLIGQAGFSASESIAAMEAIANLATGTLSSMNTAADLVTTTIRVFQMDASEATRVVDVFTNAVNNSKLTIDKIKTAMNYLGPIAKRAGISFEDTATSLMMLANSGIRASSMATGLRRVIKELVSPSEKMQEAIAMAGYSMNDLNPQVNDMRDVIGRLGNVVTDSAEAFELFGLRGATTASALATQGVAAFDEMSNAVKQQGTAARNAAIQLKGLGIQFKQLQDKSKNLALAIGDAGLTSVLSGVVNTARKVVDAFTRIMEHKVTAWIIKLTVGIAALVVVMGTLKMVFGSALIIKWGASIIGATKALKALYVVAGANPWGAVAVVLGIVIAKYLLFKKTLEETTEAQLKAAADARKTSDTLSSEIENVKKFNESGKSKLKLVDRLAKTYPAYAEEIYKTNGNLEALVVTLKKVQDLQDALAITKAKAAAKSYSKLLKEQAEEVEKYRLQVLAAEIYDRDGSEALEKLNNAQSKYNGTLGDTIDNYVQMQESGATFEVSDFFDKDDLGEVEEGYREYERIVNSALAARNDFIAAEDNTREKALIESSAQVLQNKLRADEKALILATKTQQAKKEEVEVLKRAVVLAKEQGDSESNLVRLKNKVKNAELAHSDALENTNRLTQGILNKQAKLVKMKVEVAELAKEEADFHGSKKAMAIADENLAYAKQLALLEEKAKIEIDEGGLTVDVTDRLFRKQVIAKKRHENAIHIINNDAMENAIGLKEKLALAEEKIDAGSFQKIKENQIKLLQTRKDTTDKLVAAKQIELDRLRSVEADDSDLVINKINEILELKKKSANIEEKLILRRTKLITDSYEVELSKINESASESMRVLDMAYSRGSISAAAYEKRKRNIQSYSAAQTLSAASTHRTEIFNIEKSSDVARQKAVADLAKANATVYEQEVAHANRNKKRREDEADAEKKKKADSIKYDKQRMAAARRAAEYISGLYNSVGNFLGEIGGKAVEMASDGNMHFAAIAANIKNSTSEVTQWENKIKTAKKSVEQLKTAAMHSFGGWSMLYRRLADLWTKAAAAAGEKLNYLKDMKKLQNTEVNDLTNVAAVQAQLNSLRSKYIYLGKEDLKNLNSAKLALQEQLNAQRIVNAEKQNSRLTELQGKLASAEAAGVDISAFGFDPAAKARLDLLQKESKELDAKLAKQEYADALHFEEMKRLGMAQTDIDTAKADAETRLKNMKDPQALRDLEMSAISSKLDVEVLNLTIINDLKIAQYAEQVEREQKLHEQRLENIAIENAAQLRRIKNEVDDTAEPSLNTRTGPYKSIMMAAGGKLPGDSKVDSVPVLARPGEWFIRNESADHWSSKFGDGFMNGINKPLSVAGRTISSALSKASNLSSIAVPQLSPAPQFAFAGGGSVPSTSGSTDGLTSKLDKLIDILNRNSNGDSITNNISVSATELTEEGIRRVVIPVMERIQKRKY